MDNVLTIIIIHYLTILFVQIRLADKITSQFSSVKYVIFQHFLIHTFWIIEYTDVCFFYFLLLLGLCRFNFSYF